MVHHNKPAEGYLLIRPGEGSVNTAVQVAGDRRTCQLAGRSPTFQLALTALKVTRVINTLIEVDC